MPIQSSTSHTVFAAREDTTLSVLPTEAVMIAAFEVLPPGSFSSPLHPAVRRREIAATETAAMWRMDVNGFMCYLSFRVYNSDAMNVLSVPGFTPVLS